MEKIIERVVDMPVGVKACVVEDADGDYNVYVNARYDKVQRECAALHELRHVICNDFHSGLPLELIEDLY